MPLKRFITSAVANAIDDSAENEVPEVKNGEISGGIAYSYKLATAIAACLGLAMTALFILVIKELTLGIIIGTVTAVALGFLPTLFSYRFVMTSTHLSEEYLVLFVKISKKVQLSELKYKRLKKDETGKATMLHLYNSDKKRVMSFDGAIVGFKKIVSKTKHLQELK